MSKLLFLCILLLIGFTSCDNNNEKAIMGTISGILDRTRTHVVQGSEQVCESLDGKLKDPMVQAKAEIWAPKAHKARALSGKLYRYLDSLKTQVKLYSKSRRAVRGLINREGIRLYKDLLMYCGSFSVIVSLGDFALDPAYQEYLKKDAQFMLKYNGSLLGFWKDSIRSSPMEAKQWVNNQFGECAPAQILLMLNKLQADVLMIEKSMIDYFHVQIPTPCGLSYNSFSFIALINSNFVKAGQNMEVVAGQGECTLALKPRISISDSSLSVSPDGTATYSFIAKEKPGIYSIPIKISYTGVDGQDWTVVKHLEYIISQ